MDMGKDIKAWTRVTLKILVTYVDGHQETLLDGAYECMSELDEAKGTLVERIGGSGGFFGVGSCMVRKATVRSVEFLEEYR